jgi:hypothetical protein
MLSLCLRGELVLNGAESYCFRVKLSGRHVVKEPGGVERLREPTGFDGRVAGMRLGGLTQRKEVRAENLPL